MRRDRHAPKRQRASNDAEVPRALRARAHRERRLRAGFSVLASLACVTPQTTDPKPKPDRPPAGRDQSSPPGDRAPTPARAENGTATASERPVASADHTTNGASAPDHRAEEPARVIELAVPGFLPSVLSLPRTSRFPQPLMIVAHGAGGWPEFHCQLWREMLGARGAILCTRGRAMVKGSERDGFYYPDHLVLGRELRAALQAVSEAHPDHIDAADPVYAGYSQGAEMGFLALADAPELAPRVLMVEGGAGVVGGVRARRFARGGGRALALVCGTPGCQARSARASRALSDAGIASFTYHAPGAGHTVLGGVTPLMREAFEALTAGDPRWAPHD